MSGLFTWAVPGRRLPRVRRVPAGVLHTQAELHDVMMEENGRDDGSGPPDRADPGWEEAAAHLRYASDVMEVVETYVYRPALGFFTSIVTAAKRLQSGRLDAYLLYMLIALVSAKPSTETPAVSSSVPRSPKEVSSTGNRKTPMNAPSLPTPAEMPCPVARMSTG